MATNFRTSPDAAVADQLVERYRAALPLGEKSNPNPNPNPTLIAALPLGEESFLLASLSLFLS